jgi:hypothetical protein
VRRDAMSDTVSTTIVVALNAQLLRRIRLTPDAA